jgi:hypothetical protein
MFDTLSPDGERILLATLSNAIGGPVHHEFAHNEEDLQRFISDYDHPGRALYRVVSRLATDDELGDGAAPFTENRNKYRCKENVRDTIWVWSEVDFKDHPDTEPEEIRRRLLSAGVRPTSVIFSGHGYHILHRLTERVDASPGPGAQELEETLRLACAYVGGDPHVAEVSRLMRLPGSHNTRAEGENLLVEVIHHDPDIRYGFAELTDLLIAADPIMPPPKKKEKDAPAGGGSTIDTAEWNGPLETDAALMAMGYKEKDNPINVTQQRVSCKLIREGKKIAEIVPRVLAATQAAVMDNGDCKSWDWGRERGLITDKCMRFINDIMRKDGEDLSHVLPDNLSDDWQDALKKGVRPQVCSYPGRGWHVRGYPWERAKKAPLSSDITEELEEVDAPETAPPDEDEDERTLIEAGAWLHGSAPPPVPRCSFERFLPEVGAGTLVAQYGCHKTHVITDLAVAFATPDEESTFAGRKRMRRGGVVLIEFENSGIPLRVACAAKHRRAQGVLPLMALPSAPPIIIGKKVNPEAIKWYRKVLSAAQRTFQKRFRLPLVMVGIDPLIDAADLENENDNSEANRAMKAFDDLAKEFNCLFVVNDHAGKDATRGSRGASSKPGKSHFILILPEKVESPATRRTMTVKKLRAQPDGWGAEFWLEVEDVETEGGGTASNLAVSWGDEVRGDAPREEKPKGGRPPRQQLAALKVLFQLTSKLPRRADASAWVSLERMVRGACKPARHRSRGRG